jgi:hypothetical protein
MAALKLQVGSEVKYYCSKCSLELAHTVLAMVGGEPVRVRCNTCRSERNYRGAKRLTSVLDSEASTRAARPKLHQPDMYRAKLKEFADRTPKTYRIDIEVVENDVIDHPKFGRGIVTKLIHPDRMDILFQDENRVLMRKSSES